LTLRLTLKDSWTHEASGRFPRYAVTLRHVTPVGDDAHQIVQVRSSEESDFGDILGWLPQHPRVLHVEVLDRSPTLAIAHVRSRGLAQLPRIVAENGGFALRPTTLEGGAETWTLGLGGRDSVQRLLQRLTEAHLSADIVDLSRDDAGGTALTDSQRRALTLALTQGYYAFPRRTSPAELAKEMGVSKSTYLEHLHKGEAKVFAAFFHHI